MEVCNYDKKVNEVPFSYHFATSLPIISGILTHNLYPIKVTNDCDVVLMLIYYLGTFWYHPHETNSRTLETN